MIIGSRFAWKPIQFLDYVPTTKMFRIFKELKTVEDVSPDDLVGKDIVSNIRRLPEYMLTWATAQHRFHHFPLPKPEEFLSANAGEVFQGLLATIGDSSLQDTTITHLLRHENLHDDFLTMMACYYPISEEEVTKVKKIKIKPNKASNHFSSTQIKQMYNNNPLWAEVEIRAYGKLMI